MIRIWHPMRDPHHCCFRMIALRSATSKSMSISRASLLDVFLLFPEYLHEIQYTGFGELRSRLRRIDIPKPDDTFVRLPDIRTVFRELQVFQKAAFHQLVAKNILSSNAFEEGKLDLSNQDIPTELVSEVNAYLSENQKQMSFIVDDLSPIPLDGPTGLFRRTKLELGGRIR